MFTATKVRAKITEEDPVFKVKYIGCIETFVPSGHGCTNIPVQKLWDNAGSEKSMKKTTVVINTNGILLKDTEKKHANAKLFSIENISFCNAESAINDNIFAWICKDDAAPSLVCHAVLCSSKEKAKAMALVLSRAFQIAYKEWKMNKTKLSRDNKKQQNKQSDSAQSNTTVKRRDSEIQTEDRKNTSTDGIEENGSNSDQYVNHMMVARKDSQSQTEVKNGDSISDNGNESVYEEPMLTKGEAGQTSSASANSNGHCCTVDSTLEKGVSKNAEVQTETDPNQDETESCASK